jgi:hypothetical protein
MASRHGGKAGRPPSRPPPCTYRTAAWHKANANIAIKQADQAKKGQAGAAAGWVRACPVAGRSFWERSLATGARCEIESLPW